MHGTQENKNIPREAEELASAELAACERSVLVYSCATCVHVARASCIIILLASVASSCGGRALRKGDALRAMARVVVHGDVYDGGWVSLDREVRVRREETTARVVRYRFLVKLSLDCTSFGARGG